MLSTTVRVYIGAEPIDMRKSIDSLSMLVSPMFDQNALLCDETKYVAANREHATRHSIPWHWQRRGSHACIFQSPTSIAAWRTASERVGCG
ncbi:IS66 family insertion sequence element accessory protein TnpB [Cupriavidus sp. SK-3]|uniref:IS66 family insertion sequence element accessory protein TnpB n=1 Tax=Cupriavidus TaxID=106589 RepID=UPI0026C23F49